MVKDKQKVSKHPTGLYVLFLVEMCERFSFYGMKAILILCLKAAHSAGGFEMNTASAMAIYGYYASSCYLFNFVGGGLAKYIGSKEIVCIGGFILSIGHVVLALHDYRSLIIGLILVSTGTNLLKPNIAPLLFAQYPAYEEDRINEAIYIFYRGINIGSFFGGFIVGYLGLYFNYQLALSVSSLAMLIGQIVFLVYYKSISSGNIENKSVNKKVEITQEILKEYGTNVRLKRNIAIFFVFVIIFLFTMAFDAGCSVMTIIASESMNNVFLGYKIPIPWYHSIFNAFMIIVVASAVNRACSTLSSFSRLGLGLFLGGFSFIPIIVGIWQVDSGYLMPQSCYILQQILCTLGELNIYALSLSFIIRLSPVNTSGLVMGLVFTSIGLANYCSVNLYSYLCEIMSSNIFFFSIMVITLSIVGGVIVLTSKKLQRLTCGIK